ncbi:MAG: hypothetical protein KJ062_22835, partial [Thermoanaerobaculia bacterium]|nr:hypothetical protein [Thermoanaerobaculia bacterium]
VGFVVEKCAANVAWPHRPLRADVESGAESAAPKAAFDLSRLFIEPEGSCAFRIRGQEQYFHP